MATYVKGNIRYMPAVEQINRKFAPRKKTCSAPKLNGPVKTETSSWMGGATNSKFRAGLGSVSKNFLVFRENAIATPPTSNQRLGRANFARAKGGQDHILHDVTQLSRVQNLWFTAKDDLSKTINEVSALGYTFNGWVFAVQYAGLKEDSSYDENTFPAAFDE